LTGSERTAKGFVLVAIDPGRFMDITEFRNRVDQLIRDVRDSEPAEGVERIWLPGEPEHHRRRQRERDGIPLPGPLVAELDDLAAEVGASKFLERAVE
jgi:LDH2 family malate/lactate/ureidoglycolate dehydrogenase